jgi:hypothetical protein
MMTMINLRIADLPLQICLGPNGQFDFEPSEFSIRLHVPADSINP